MRNQAFLNNQSESDKVIVSLAFCVSKDPEVGFFCCRVADTEEDPLTVILSSPFEECEWDGGLAA